MVYFYSLLINTRIYYDDVSNDDKQRYTSTKKCKSKFIFEEIEFENWSNTGNFLSNDPIL